LHDYFPLKLLGKYLLLYNKSVYCVEKNDINFPQTGLLHWIYNVF